MLTERQRKILASHANGYNLCEVAGNLCYSYVTIRKDVERAKRRLGAFNLAQAVVLAISAGEVVLLDNGSAEPRP